MSSENEAARVKHFYETINDPDALTVVVRGHTHLHAALSLTVRDALPGVVGSALARLRFMESVDLAVALLRLDGDLRPMFEVVNTVRNRFAHGIDAAVTDGEAAKLVDLLARHGYRWEQLPPTLATSSGNNTRTLAWCMSVLHIRISNGPLSLRDV